jgi:hypothetical protein
MGYVRYAPSADVPSETGLPYMFVKWALDAMLHLLLLQHGRQRRLFVSLGRRGDAISLLSKGTFGLGGDGPRSTTSTARTLLHLFGRSGSCLAISIHATLPVAQSTTAARVAQAPATYGSLLAYSRHSRSPQRQLRQLCSAALTGHSI